MLLFVVIVPSLAENEEGSALYTKMSRELGEEWAPYKGYTMDDNYHKFEVEWTPKHLIYKIDDKEIRVKEGVEALDKGLNLVMSILKLEEDSVSAGWDGPKAPYYTDIDYVEVYHYDAGEDSFWLNFRDDFDTYDQSRWVSADNITWDGNDSTIKKENAYKNGHLQLKLDTNVDYHGDDDHHDDEDFHVLPAPKDGTLDAAIEKALSRWLHQECHPWELARHGSHHHRWNRHRSARHHRHGSQHFYSA
jgi:hypothetical protein